MLFNAASALNMSPPLRPALPSSLYSPYIGAVPYIGARPYVVAGFSLDWSDVDFIRCFCTPMFPRIEPANEENAVWVIECWIVAMLCAVIVFVYMCAFDEACAPVPNNDTKEIVKKVVCFMLSLFFNPLYALRFFYVLYYSINSH